jgi:hypothetical protein
MTLCRAFISAALLSASVFSQSTSTGGDIRGVVTDPSGGAIARAKLTLSNPGRGYTRTAESDAMGEYSIPIVPPGVYSLRVEAQGFNTKVMDNIQVRVGDSIGIPVMLDVGNVTTEVKVIAETPVIEPERVQQANTIESRQIGDLPINKRNFLDFAVLAPGVVSTQTLADDTSFRPIQTPNSGLSFGGSNGRGNGFFIDGVENYMNSGGVRPTVSQEMAQEFQINRNSFSAEFGNASGGMVNIITKSGANDWHGDLFGFLRHRDIQARNYFDPGKSAFTRSQAGATAGGALKRDKAFVFAAFERLERQETSFVPLLQDRSAFTQVTPGQDRLLRFLEASGNAMLAGLARQGRQLLTPGNNPRVNRLFDQNSGTFPFAERLTTLGLKLDYRFSDRHNAFLRSNTTWNPQSNNTRGALDGYNRGNNVNTDDTTAMINDEFVFNPRWIMETRAMFNYNRLDVTPVDPYGPELNINGYGFFGRQIFLPYHGIERHYQILQNYSFLTSQHNLKFGWDFNPVRDNQLSETFFSGRFTFGARIPLALVLQSAAGDPNLPATLIGLLQSAGQTALIPQVTAPLTALQSYSLGIPELYQQGFGDPNYVIKIFRNNFYVQDTWKAHPRLTLNLGVRYELERHNPVVPRDNNNVGPRFGFAWTPAGKTVVRGGYGLYYSMVNAQVSGVADPLSGKYINQILLTASSTLFRDPRTNQFVTSATVYQTLLAQGVIGSRTITQNDLAQFGIRVGPNLPGSVVFGVDPAFQNPWAHQASFEIEHQIGDYAISIGYNFNRGAHLARISGRNVRYTGQRLPDGRPTFALIDPRILQKNIFVSDANSFYHAGILQVTRRYSKRLSMNLSYTWSKAIDESTDFNSDYSPQDQLNARAERALSAFNQSHRVVFSAIYDLPAKGRVFRNWSFSPIVQYSSWRPFNVLTGFDAQGDTYVNNKRPAGLGRNMGQGPDFVTFDARISRRFHYSSVEGRYLEFLAEGFNLPNRTNFRAVNNIVGDVPISALPSPIVGNRGPATSPLAFTSALDPRQFQFGIKIYW